MNAKELGRSLLACDAPNPDGSQAVLGRLLGRDRWRMRILGGVTVLLWALAAASVVFLVWFYVVYIQPKLTKLSADSDMPTEMRNLVLAGELAAQYITGVAAATFLAALSTVWLVFATRRATLGQVSEQLTEISRHLRELRQAQDARPADPPTGAG